MTAVATATAACRSPPELAERKSRIAAPCHRRQAFSPATRVSGVEYPTQLKVSGKIVIVTLVAQERRSGDFTQAMIERRRSNAGSTERVAAQLIENGDLPSLA